MGLKVKFSFEASNQLEDLVEYLRGNWSEKVVLDFYKKLQSKLTVASNQPELFVESKNVPYLRRCIVSKQTSFYYQFNESELVIIGLFDNRMNPKKLEQKLKK